MNSKTTLIGTTYQSVLGAIINSQRSERVPSITQAEIAEQLNITMSTWSRIERGESSLSLEQMVKLAAFLDLPLSVLFKLVEERIEHLRAQGISVAVSKEALESEHAIPLTTTQLLGLLPAIGPVGAVAFGLYKALRGLKKGE